MICTSYHFILVGLSDPFSHTYHLFICGGWHQKLRKSVEFEIFWNSFSFFLFFFFSSMNKYKSVIQIVFNYNCNIWHEVETPTNANTKCLRAREFPQTKVSSENGSKTFMEIISWRKHQNNLPASWRERRGLRGGGVWLGGNEGNFIRNCSDIELTFLSKTWNFVTQIKFCLFCI